jgi:NIMA (never in mitosis gene a)-related kinase
MPLSEFQILNKLGEGSYSIVYKAKRLSDGLTYALKIVKISMLKDREKQNALNEVRILASINHENVISYKEAFFDEPSSSLW